MLRVYSHQICSGLFFITTYHVTLLRFKEMLLSPGFTQSQQSLQRVLLLGIIDYS